MDVALTIDNESLKALVTQGLQARMQEQARDLRPAWDGVLEAFYDAEARLFANEGRNDEEPEWAQLKNGGAKFHGGVGYSTWKGINFPGAKILHLSGKLERQLTRSDGGGFVNKAPQALTVGTDYETYEGVTYNREGVPERPRSLRDRLTGDLGGITAEGRDDYYPMDPRTPIRIDENTAFALADPIVDHLLKVSG